MKRINRFTRILSLLLLICIGAGMENLNGQTRKVGDLYTFEDGTQGIVFYVNPDYPHRGWAVALHDLDTLYPLDQIDNCPSSLNPYTHPYPYRASVQSWNFLGWNNTMILKNAGTSEAANAVAEFGKGWYIPDAMQLRILYGLLATLKAPVESAGGSLTSFFQEVHWSSSMLGSYYGALGLLPDGTFTGYGLTNYYLVRPIRDYEDSPLAYWLDNPGSAELETTPLQTTDYDAVILYMSDSVFVKNTVEVYETYNQDTIREQTEVSSTPYTSPSNPVFSNINVSVSGEYLFHDTAATMHGCDSVITLMLTVRGHYYYDTICPLQEDYYFAPFDTIFRPGTASGHYVHHGSKVTDNGIIDTVAFYELLVWPDYRSFDTVKWCLYEDVAEMIYDQNPDVRLHYEDGVLTLAAESDGVVIEDGDLPEDFVLGMKTVHGCDSIVYLHVNVSKVMRDTLYYDVFAEQIADGRITAACRSFEGITEPGMYVSSDTLAGSNGCDSISTIVLIVEPLHHDTICNHSFTPAYLWVDNLEDYQWHGQPLPETVGLSGYYEFVGQKWLNGTLMDTVSYLQLTILPTYDEYDTVTICLYENSVTVPYALRPGVTIAVDNDRLSVFATGESETEVMSTPNDEYDYALRMSTLNGCDSLLFLHVNLLKVSRDSIREEVFLYQVEEGRVTVAHHVFENIEEAGTYYWSDTLPRIDGCDSILVLELDVSPCITDFSIVCPPDVYDTLAFGDCVMKIYPEQIGEATLVCSEEWPFTISNEIPAEHLFRQGDNVVLWIVTDGVCGFRDTCEQHVVIAYPKCPDAVDCEGNLYHGVRIGCDCWTQRNLESTKYSDCEDITGVYAYASLQHPDTAANVATFGHLYTYEAAIRDGDDNGYGHVQGICPEGWYLPTPEKYEALNAYGSYALKSPLLWTDGGGNNSTGFTALPAGFYNGVRNRYEGLLSETYFWSTQNVGHETVNHPVLFRHDCDAALLNHSHAGLAYSVRCIKEKE